MHGLEERGLHFLYHSHSLTASFFGRDLALDANWKGVRLGIIAVPDLDRHCSVERNLVFEDHDLLNVIQQELPSGRNLSSR